MDRWRPPFSEIMFNTFAVRKFFGSLELKFQGIGLCSSFQTGVHVNPTSFILHYSITPAFPVRYMYYIFQYPSYTNCTYCMPLSLLYSPIFLLLYILFLYHPLSIIFVSPYFIFYTLLSYIPILRSPTISSTLYSSISLLLYHLQLIFLYSHCFISSCSLPCYAL